jgi:hypothetical protein
VNFDADPQPHDHYRKEEHDECDGEHDMTGRQPDRGTDDLRGAKSMIRGSSTSSFAACVPFDYQRILADDVMEREVRQREEER